MVPGKNSGQASTGLKKLEQLFCDWKGLKKNKNRQTKTQRANEATFTEIIAGLFDIAHANAIELIDAENYSKEEKEKDKLFLELQRQKGQPGCMLGVDKVVLLQQQKQKEKQYKLQSQRHRSEQEKSILSESVVLESSSSNNSENS